MIPSWNGDDVFTEGVNPQINSIRTIMKNFTKQFLAGMLGTIAALGVAVTTTPKAEAGGIYWNNNGGGGVVVNRGYYYGPRPGYYNYGPRYYRRGAVVGPNGACARGFYGRGGCVRY